MALRLTAPSEDILGANYKITKIVASDYNPNIDSTITVTVTVKDVYDDPVENESVQVTCNIGKFTKLNGSTISDTQSVTGNTDSNGQFALTYTCSEWGLATFSANNKTLQIHVNGIITVQTVTYGTLRINKGLRLVQFKYYRESYNFASTGWVTLHTQTCGDYKPITEMACATTNPTISFLVTASGDIKAQSTSTGTRTIEATATWYY